MNVVKVNDKDFLKVLLVNKCIECGLCLFVCLFKIYLIDYMCEGKCILRG